MLIKLLQSFSSVVLDPASAPPASLPPPAWKKSGGRKAIEQIMPKVHLIVYSNVRSFFLLSLSGLSLIQLSTARAACGSRWRKLKVTYHLNEKRAFDSARKGLLSVG